MATSRIRLFVAVWFASMTAPCSAASVGINYAAYGPPPAVSTLAPTDITGVVPQGNWNNVAFTLPQTTYLVDDAGNPTTVPWPNVLSVWAESIVPASTPTGALLHGGMLFDRFPTPSPYPVYDLYVYISPKTPLSGSTAIVNVRGLGSTPSLLLDLTGAPVLTEATPTSPGNFVRFANLTLPNITVLSVGSSALIAGLQFVAVPEPSTFVLVTVALACLSARHWRRRFR